MLQPTREGRVLPILDEAATKAAIGIRTLGALSLADLAGGHPSRQSCPVDQFAPGSAKVRTRHRGK